MGCDFVTTTTAILIPSRNRPDAATAAWQSVHDHALLDTHAFILYDEDQADLYAEVPGGLITPRFGSMNACLNYWAAEIADKYDFIGFMGDDHRVRTPNFDALLIDQIGAKPGIAYGDDLLQGEALPTAVVMSSQIVQALGFMAPPDLKHLFMDNFWLTIGHHLENANYVPEVVIEHLHFINGKAEQDAGYLAVNNADVHNHDQQVFKDYLINNLESDLAKVKTWMS